MLSTQLNAKSSRFKQSNIRIPSSIPGWDLDAWRFTPVKVSPPCTVIIMAHGVGGNKSMGLRPYAEFFASLGYVAFVFDFRHWGLSDGSPRNVLGIREQLEDYRMVVKFCRHQFDLDPNRIIIWGTSLSGGYVTTLAAERDLNLYAVIAQCPYLGSTARLPFSWTFVKTFVHGLVDALSQAMGYGPHYIKNCAPVGEVAVLNMPGCWEGFQQLARGFPSADIQNETNASVIFTLRGYQPRDTAYDINCPILLINMTNDILCGMDAVDDCEARISSGYLTNVKLDGGHFDAYPNGPLHQESLSAMKEFLEKSAPV